jgi:hypothetical protein
MSKLEILQMVQTQQKINVFTPGTKDNQIFVIGVAFVIS